MRMKILLSAILLCAMASRLSAQVLDIPANSGRNWGEISKQKEFKDKAEETTKEYAKIDAVLATTHYAARTATVNPADYSSVITDKAFRNKPVFNFPFVKDKYEEKKQLLQDTQKALNALCTVSTEYKITNGMVQQIENEYNRIMSLLLIKMYDRK